ncbi:MAG: copper homeostasis protein CutC [Muribaculaceae bacterium]|nr:copper homeostasis protein CutC [Muribaculaceae bacterium]
MKATLEICAGDMASVIAAAQGGADRVELCQGLAVGGLTPSIGFIKMARKVPGIKMHVLIRPREGDFVYTDEEIECMIHDIKAARSCNADGIVIGALMPDGRIDMNTCRILADEAEGMSVTFHRAFDLARDPMEALEDVMTLGCDRILTSGQAPDALSGAEILFRLQKAAGHRLSIMAGCGVTSSNAAEILRRSGCSEIHASARRIQLSSMTYRNESVAMGAAGSDEYIRKSTHRDEVRAIVDSINQI